MVGIKEKANSMKTAHDCVRRIYTLYQKPIESLDDYFDRFKELWNTAEAAGGNNMLVPVLPANCPIYGSMDQNAKKEAAMVMFAFLHVAKVCSGQKCGKLRKTWQ